MKNKLSLLLVRIQTLDRAYLRLAYMVFALALAAFQLSPDDGSGGR